ncbi:MAG: ABC transporter permease [Chitinophagaceae bacterium]|nr:ABC transporter permease [Chitinophagaceae bacterium]
MFKNYFKTAWRSLWKNKFYSAINILGLSIGLTTAILLLLWIEDERSFDKSHKNYQHIYNLSAHFNANGKEQAWTGVPGPIFKYASTLPQVAAVVRIKDNWGLTVHQQNSTQLFYDIRNAYVDSSFFSIFSFPLLKGSVKNPFPGINTVLLTASTAKKIYGTDDVVGKIMMQDTSGFVISGVLQDFPANSSLRFDALFPMSKYAQEFTAWGGNFDWKTIDEDLGNYAYDTYLKLQPNANIAAVENALAKSYKDARNGDSETKFLLQPLADKHLIGPDGNKSALRVVQVFTIVAFLLLAIAAVNYVNLSTARSMSRAKEVGVRKIIGANRFQLFVQFAGETIIIFTIALLLALFFAALLVPAYNSISGKTLSFSLANPSIWMLVGFAVAGTFVLAGVYPALHLSSFSPINSLKGKLSQSFSNVLLRKVLVVFQFSISVTLIICTLIIGRQMRYISKMNVGFNKEYVFTVGLSDDAQNHIDAVKSQLKKEPGILSTSLSNVYDISDYGIATGDIEWQGKSKNDNMVVSVANVDKDFIPLMNFNFIEGSNFSGTPADTSHFIINQTMAKQMGLKQPYVGTPIKLFETPGTIIGVVKDFHFKSLKEVIGPFAFQTRRWKNMLYVKTTTVAAQKAIRAVENVYNKYKADSPFAYSFVDEKFDQLYKNDNRTKLLFNIFAGIAIFISCLGLLALATYSAQLRTKEIGVRKVLGASVTSIVRLLGRDFILLVFIAIVISIPVAWYGMNKWLENFVYKTTINFWLFVAASCIAIGIALLTISYQAIKAALANPVKSLRTE